jgi:hypothetical protein|uniref:Uncharacterized protein n=1 Tax=uncultured bacterium A1Q1_fos_1053 TaxID=1256539 RepID=L7VVN7_9BACT|nr:hypothetical protein [uncultured bacterium A1Q1_fos_1053]
MVLRSILEFDENRRQVSAVRTLDIHSLIERLAVPPESLGAEILKHAP